MHPHDRGGEPPELTSAANYNGNGYPSPEPLAHPHQLPDPDDEPLEELSSSVRAYAWTGGRTRPRHHLGIETLVSATSRAMDYVDYLRSEHRSVVLLCRSTISVAEIGALLSLPLSVVRVLLDDMEQLDLVDVHHNPMGLNDQPDLELLERVRLGLVNLSG